MTPEEINKLLQNNRDQKFRKRTEGQLFQGSQLKGRERPEQSELMKINNPMSGKEHPNKGKAMPQIGRPGVPKPEGFGEQVSKARKGKPIPKLQGRSRPDHSEVMKDPERNKGAKAMSELHTCPHCGKTANLPNYKRWHGDNCKHKK
jgi:hypothetical protein